MGGAGAAPWRCTVGAGPRKVTALELTARKGIIYLRWRAHGNWVVESLGTGCRTASGRLIKTACDHALRAARDKYHELETAAAAVAAPPRPDRALTLTDTPAVVFAPATGRWKAETAHGREVARALAIAAAHWGASTAWATVTRAHWRSLWRHQLAALRARGHGGYRGAELVVQRVATIAAWLVEEGHVDRIPQPERDWRRRLAEDYTHEAGTAPSPHRPRHTLDELRRILEAAMAHGDPRFALLLALGAELRLGQVLRCRRNDLTLTEGTLRVPGRGGKRGTIVQLTAGQVVAAQTALCGVLRELERTGQDFPLFPAGQLPGGRSGRAVADPARHLTAPPIGRRWVLAQFRLAERRAGVPHVPGRAAYGMRRAAVDAVKSLGISREGLQAHGGWSDTQVPDKIYADAEAVYARAEAARLRAVGPAGVAPDATAA